MPSTAELLRKVVTQAVPNSLQQLAWVLVNFITVVFVSQTHDSEVLAGVGVGSMLYNIFGLSLGIGFSSALDTFVSQSNGACRYETSGIYLQRAVVICFLVSVPALAILNFVEDILLAIGQDPAIASSAGAYVHGTMFSLWPMYFGNCLSTYLRAQTLPQAATYVTWASNVFHLCSCYVFLVYLQLGAFGAGLAFAATQSISCLMLLSYVHFLRPGVCKHSWVSWDCRKATSVSHLNSFLKKALPCAMLMWAEWWCAELMTLLAGYLGVKPLAAHTAVLQVFVLIYMTAGGISCAGAVLVGNTLGAGDATLAKRSAAITSLVMLVACVAIDAVLFFGADAISRRLTNDPDVAELMRSAFNVLLVVVPLDALQTVIDGVLRGVGKQGVAFKIKLVCMWGIRIPLAALLAFQARLGLVGVWLGSAAGLAATMAIYVWLVLRIDWQEEVAQCYHLLGTPDSRNLLDVNSFSPVPGMLRSPALSLDATSSGPAEEEMAASGKSMS